ncbi:MucBP domain-containing protein, partial [Weissella kandleri]|uniref:MucBP domain-containing protein n=1 Tax=Weissella kandleri TaxID=1616 RepID=UPI000AAA1E0E
IPGYIFAEAKDGNESGKFTDKPQTVTMIYKKLKDNTPVMPVQDGTLTVKYVDENGKEIAKSVVTKEKAGTAYKTEKKDIEGYTFKEVKGNEVGKYVAGNQTVTYVYTKNDNHNVTPTDPNKPDTPNDSGQTNQPGNNNVGKDTGSSDGNVVNNVVNGIQSALPKTAAEKTTLAG